MVEIIARPGHRRQVAARLMLLRSGRIDCPLRGRVALQDCLRCERLRSISTLRRPRIACETNALRILDAY